VGPYVPRPQRTCGAWSMTSSYIPAIVTGAFCRHFLLHDLRQKWRHTWHSVVSLKDVQSWVIYWFNIVTPAVDRGWRARARLPAGKKIFLFATTNRPTLGPSHRVEVARRSGIKRPENETYTTHMRLRYHLYLKIPGSPACNVASPSSARKNVALLTGNF
jgi:hypothetical protein